LSLLVDPSEVAATVLGSLSAALECEAEGNIPVGPEDVLRKLQASKNAPISFNRPAES